MAKLNEAPKNFRGMTPLDIEAHAICKVWLTPRLCFLPNPFKQARHKLIAMRMMQAGFNPKVTPISPTRSPTRPRLPITSPDFDYTPARATNVAETWRRFGWIAPLKAPKCP